MALCLAACGDDDSDAITNLTLQSPLINYDENAFADRTELRAHPDDIVTLRLEDPSGNYEDALDTGEEPGVDVIPYTYPETMERQFCWQVAAGAEVPPATGAPSFMLLVNDETGDVPLRLEQGGACIRQTIPAGRYSAVFHHGASGLPDRDLLFIVPQAGAATAAASPASAGGDQGLEADPPPPAGAAPMPYCSILPVQQTLTFFPVAIAGRAIEVDRPSCPGPFVPESIEFDWEVFWMNGGGCSDFSLIRGMCKPAGEKYLVGPFLGYYARVYADVFFRGPRKTLDFDVGPSPTAGSIHLQELFALSGTASMALVHGTRDLNGAFLIFAHGCDGCDLSGVDLHGADLEGASLRLADLSHASLENANLRNVAAQQAIFKSAYLRGVNLRGAHLQGATFDSAGRVEDTNGQVYPAADLSQAHLDGAVATDAFLRGATLTGATLTGALLDGADLSRVSAVKAVFEGASLRSTVLTGATLTEATFDGARLEAANLQGATLLNARLPEARLDGAQLQKDQNNLAATLDGAYMANATLNDGADLTGVSMRGTRFYGDQASAVGAIFNQAHLEGAILSGTNFTGARFQSATLDRAVCVNCKFNTAHLERTASVLTDAASLVGTDLRGADFTQATVDGCNFTGATVSFADTTGVYQVGAEPEVVYTAQYLASALGPLTTAATVRCPSGVQGPCDTREKLTAPQPTPTATLRAPTPTTAAGCTPDPVSGVFCPTPTPKGSAPVRRERRLTLQGGDAAPSRWSPDS